MKKLLVTTVASLSLLVAAPVASAAGPPSNAPIPVQMKHVSCTLSNGFTTQSWSFVLPSMAVSYFQTALARLQQYYPALSCSIS